MIIVRQGSYAFLQIGVFNDRAERLPSCAQFRIYSCNFNAFSAFIKKNLNYANHIRDTYHDDAGSKSKYSMGNVDTFVTYDRIPIVLVTLPAFMEFNLVVGTDVLALDATELEEIANKLLKL